MSEESLHYHNLGSDDGWFLVFPEVWVGTKLPVSPKKREDYTVLRPELVVTLLDTRDGKEYTTSFWQHYCPFGGDGGGNTWLHPYMVQEHYCACHRKADALAAGADTDEECDGERFVVKSVVCRAWPKLIPYSETMTVGELEATLTEGLNTPGEVRT